MITVAQVEATLAGLDMAATPTSALLAVSANLDACRAVADAEATEAIARAAGRINGILKRRAAQGS